MTRGKQASRAGILFSDVKPKRLEWDWYPFIPRGKVVIVDGEPEEGKSAFILDLMARITTGRSMPFAAELRGWSEVPSREPRGVVFLSAEDDLDDTLIPRAMAAGADRTRLIAEHFDDPLDLDQQGFARLRQLIARVKAVAVVLDPLVSYIPDRVNLYVDQASRRLLRTLRAFAKESGVTVIVIRHFTKGDPRFGRNPKHAGGGSIGIIGAVRSGLIVAPDPAEDPSAQVKVLARAKNNLVSKAAPTAVRYRLVSATEQIGDIRRRRSSASSGSVCRTTPRGISWTLIRSAVHSGRPCRGCESDWRRHPSPSRTSLRLPVRTPGLRPARWSGPRRRSASS